MSSPSVRALLFAACLLALPLRKVTGEDRVDFKFSYYLEDHHRTEVFSPALLIETDLTPNTVLKIQSVYDVISGATPTGEPPKRKTREVTLADQMAQTAFVAVSGPSGQVTRVAVPVTPGAPVVTTEEYGKPYLPMADFEDQRWALNMDLRHRQGEWVFGGGIAFSTEYDYDSIAGSMRVARDFNERHTTVTLAASLTHDDVFDVPNELWADKDSFDAQVELSQVIDADTLLKLSYVGGTSWGYLDDQYKFVLLNDEVIDEKRPDSRDRNIAFVSLNRFIKPLNGALEATYRFYRDSYGIDAHTFGLIWFQNLGKRLILAPSVRYYEQSAANFYAVQFEGNPSVYSSDYRLSKLGSITYGMQLIWKMNENFWIDVAYDRYSMWGRDNVTSGEAYPEANIITVGFKLWY